MYMSVSLHAKIELKRVQNFSMYCSLVFVITWIKLDVSSWLSSFAYLLVDDWNSLQWAKLHRPIMIIAQ